MAARPTPSFGIKTTSENVTCRWYIVLNPRAPYLDSVTRGLVEEYISPVLARC